MGNRTVLFGFLIAILMSSCKSKELVKVDYQTTFIRDTINISDTTHTTINEIVRNDTVFKIITNERIINRFRERSNDNQHEKQVQSSDLNAKNFSLYKVIILSQLSSICAFVLIFAFIALRKRIAASK